MEGLPSVSEAVAIKRATLEKRLEELNTGSLKDIKNCKEFAKWMPGFQAAHDDFWKTRTTHLIPVEEVVAKGDGKTLGKPSHAKKPIIKEKSPAEAYLEAETALLESLSTGFRDVSEALNVAAWPEAVQEHYTAWEVQRNAIISPKNVKAANVGYKRQLEVHRGKMGLLAMYAKLQSKNAWHKDLFELLQLHSDLIKLDAIELAFELREAGKLPGPPSKGPNVAKRAEDENWFDDLEVSSAASGEIQTLPRQSMEDSQPSAFDEVGTTTPGTSAETLMARSSPAMEGEEVAGIDALPGHESGGQIPVPPGRKAKGRARYLGSSDLAELRAMLAADESKTAAETPASDSGEHRELTGGTPAAGSEGEIPGRTDNGAETVVSAVDEEERVRAEIARMQDEALAEARPQLEALRSNLNKIVDEMRGPMPATTPSSSTVSAAPSSGDSRSASSPGTNPGDEGRSQPLKAEVKSRPMPDRPKPHGGPEFHSTPPSVLSQRAARSRRLMAVGLLFIGGTAIWALSSKLSLARLNPHGSIR